MENISLSSIFEGLNPERRFQLYRELWGRAARYEVLTDFPLHLDIELCGLCNLRCNDCFQNGLIEKPLGLMSFDLFRDIIEQGTEKGLCAIKLQVRGESFLHPHLFDCIRHAKKAGVMDVQITSNATLFDDECIQNILDSGIDALIISLDHHHRKSYECKYRGRSYSDVETSIKKLLSLRKKQGKSQPWIRIQSSIPDVTAESVERARADVLRKYPDADLVYISRMHDFKEGRDSYPDLHINYRMLPCGYPMQRLAIYYNGEVTTCDMDYNNRLQLGTVISQSVQEIWLSEKMQSLREMHMSGNRKNTPICKHCIASIESRNGVYVDESFLHVADSEITAGESQRHHPRR